MSDAQLQFGKCEVPEMDRFFGQRTMKFYHERFVLWSDRSNGNWSSVWQLPLTGILQGVGTNRQSRQIFLSDVFIVQDNPGIQSQHLPSRYDKGIDIDLFDPWLFGNQETELDQYAFQLCQIDGVTAANTLQSREN